MTNFMRVPYGNDFDLRYVVTKPTYEGQETIFVDFDLTQCSDIKVFLKCEKHDVNIPLEWEIEEGTTNVIIAHVIGNQLEIGSSYGCVITGKNENDKAFRWAASGEEMFSVVEDTNAQNFNGPSVIDDVNVRIGFVSPQGPQGAQGPQGVQGPQGSSPSPNAEFPKVFFKFPSINSGNPQPIYVNLDILCDNQSYYSICDLFYVKFNLDERINDNVVPNTGIESTTGVYKVWIYGDFDNMQLISNNGGIRLQKNANTTKMPTWIAIQIEGKAQLFNIDQDYGQPYGNVVTLMSYTYINLSQAPWNQNM